MNSKRSHETVKLVDVGNRIRALREELEKMIPGEYTQAAVARRLGVAANTLRAWELNRVQPRKAAAKRLAKVLGAKVEDLELNSDSGLVINHISTVKSNS